MGIFLRPGQIDPGRHPFFIFFCLWEQKGAEIADVPCWEMKCYCECLFSSLFVYHGTFSSLINLYLHKRLPRAVIPSRTGSLEVRSGSQPINRPIFELFPWVDCSFDGHVTCSGFFFFFPPFFCWKKNANICSNYLDEGERAALLDAGKWI